MSVHNDLYLLHTLHRQADRYLLRLEHAGADVLCESSLGVDGYRFTVTSPEGTYNDLINNGRDVQEAVAFLQLLAVRFEGKNRGA